MENENRSLGKIKVIYGGLFLLSGCIIGVFSFVLGKSYEAILRNVIVSLVISGTINFLLLDDKQKNAGFFIFSSYCMRS